MKKIDQPLSRNYPPIVVKVDDLEDLERVLSANGNKVKITCDDYLFESVAELAEHLKGTRIRKVEIRLSEPFVVIELNRLSAHLYVDSSNIPSSGLFFQLDQILSRCRRRASWAYSAKSFLAANVVLWVVNVAIWFLPRSVRFTTYDFVALSLVFGLIVVGTTWIGFIRTRRCSTVYIVRRREERSFFQRNRDQLAVALFSALIGALLGGTATYVVNNILRSQPNMRAEKNAPKAGSPSQ